jgi:hypothetical protein
LSGVFQQSIGPNAQDLAAVVVDGDDALPVLRQSEQVVFFDRAKMLLQINKKAQIITFNSKNKLTRI